MSPMEMRESIGTLFQLDDLTRGLLFTVVGVFVAWMLSVISEWVKERRQRKRLLRRVIFYLMELQTILRRMVIDKVLKTATEQILAIIPEDDPTRPTEDQLRGFIEGQVGAIVLSHARVELEELRADYDTAVKDLSEIDVETAYLLHGRTKVIERLDLATRAVAAGLEQQVTSEPDKQVTWAFMHTNFRPGAIKDEIKELVDFILDLSFKVGWRLNWRLGKRLARQDYVHKDIEPEIEKMIQQLIAFAQAQGAQHGR